MNRVELQTRGVAFNLRALRPNSAGLLHWREPSDLDQSELSGTPTRHRGAAGHELTITSSQVRYVLEMSVSSLGDGREVGKQ